MVHQTGDHHDIPDHHRVHRTGHWLPTDHRSKSPTLPPPPNHNSHPSPPVHREWLNSHISDLDGLSAPEPLSPILKDFQDLIESNARIYMYFNAMWDEIPVRPCYKNDPTGRKQIRGYKHMLAVMNRVFGRAPVSASLAEGRGGFFWSLGLGPGWLSG